MEILEFIKERHFISELSEKFFDNLGDSIKFIGELLAIINNPNFVIILISTKIPNVLDCV